MGTVSCIVKKAVEPFKVSPKNNVDLDIKGYLRKKQFPHIHGKEYRSCYPLINVCTYKVTTISFAY